MAVIVIANNNTLVSGTDEDNTFQLGAPNVPPPQAVTIVSGAGDDTINNYNGNKSVINAGLGNNLIINSDLAVDTSILGSGGNDSIVTSPGTTGTYISTGSGNDTIDIWSADKTTIKFGQGANVVRICADTKLMLNTAEGSNYELKYYNGASASVTLTNGAYNYSVRGSTEANVFHYNIPESNLVISSYGGEDRLDVDWPLGDASISGDDVLLSVVGNGRIRIKNAKAHTININGTDTIVGSNEITPQDVIKKFMSALDKTNSKGVAAVDEAVNACSDFKSIGEVINKMVDDCRKINNANAFLPDCCNIILDNADTGAITGWDAGTSLVKTAESIVKEEGAVQNFTGSEFNINGLTVKVPPAVNEVQQNIINGLYTWWTRKALELIEQSYGSDYRFDNPNASVREMSVEFVSDENSALALVASTYNVSNGRAVALKLRINMKYYSDLKAGNVDGVSEYQGNTKVSYLDRTLAHEFTHAVMAANIDHFNDLPAYLKEGTAEMTHGIADERRRDIETLGGDADKLLRSLIPQADANAIIVEGVNAPSYAGGFILLNYLAKQAAR